MSEDSENLLPTTEDGQHVETATPEKSTDWLGIAASSFNDSTRFVDANLRPRWDAAIRQNRGRHVANSKYHSEEYKARSKVFRPKTRTMVRKSEASAAAAFFSTLDVVSIDADDANNEQQIASAALMQELMNYRLTRTLPWFLLLCGAYQDALIQPACFSRQDWDYSKNCPRIELIPIENIRISPSAKWHDPIASSPYVIEMIPMYAHEARAKWPGVSNNALSKSRTDMTDSTRQARHGDTQDPAQETASVGDYDLIWVHHNIVSVDGQDYVYHTLGIHQLLDDPRPLSEVYLHGMRPYARGIANLETHVVYPTSPTEQIAGIQAEINDVANLRLDNVKLALGKRYQVRRNRQVDLRSLTRQTPGSVVLVQDMDDYKVEEYPDVTASSYREQDLLNLDCDDLAGAFSGSSVQSNRNLNETVGGMSLLSQSAGLVGDYQLKLFTETWVEPVLRQLMSLEAAYEDDDKVLHFAGRQMGVVDEYLPYLNMLLQDGLALSVAVGMGATNPQQKVEKLMYALSALAKLFPDMPQKLDFETVSAEVFGALGYKSGARFLAEKGEGTDPRIQELQTQVQQLQQQLSQKRSPELDAADAALKQSQAALNNVTALTKALESAGIVAAAPGLAGSADVIAKSAGVRDADGGALIEQGGMQNEQ